MTDENSASMNDVNRKKVKINYFTGALRVYKGDLQFTKNIIRLHLGDIQVSKPAGSDQIHPAITKRLANFLP